MKKLSLLMAAVMLFVSCFVFNVAAAEQLKVAISVPSSVGVGDEVTVSVNFSENTGFSTLGVKLTYPEGFTYIEDSADASDLIKEEFYLDFAGYEGETYVFYHDEEERTVTFVGAGLYDIEKASDSLFTAKFTAPSTAATGKIFEVSVIDEIYNATGNTVTFVPTNGTTDVTKSEYQKGDVNKSGGINIADAIWIFGYISGKNNIDENDTELKAIADVNNSGSVNIADAIEIFKFIAS